MKSTQFRTILFAVMFLFFIQASGTLIESIYILDLLSTNLDEKALGLLFFFTPLLLLPFRSRLPKWALWLIMGTLILSRGITPYLATTGRLMSSGLGTGAVLLLFPILIGKRSAVSKKADGMDLSAGLALATAFSVLLRAANFGIDYSLTVAGSWVGWMMALGLGWLFYDKIHGTRDEEQGYSHRFSAALGLMSVLTILLFAFSAPAVIARWTAGNYVMIVSAVSFMSLLYTVIVVIHPGWITKLLTNKALLLGGNLLFSVVFVGLILAHRLVFPDTPESMPVVVGSATWLQQIHLVLTLLSFPIIFADAAFLMDGNRKEKQPSNAFTLGLLLGVFALTVLVFIQIFTNVWGYVEPISLYFRNKFWLPFLLMVGLLTMLVYLGKGLPSGSEKQVNNVAPVWKLALTLIFILTTGFSLWGMRLPQKAEDKTTLRVMTYNIQQANDDDGEKSYLRQVALIRKINPDILALQESDSTRVSLNNNDYVRLYASLLGYYSYYGPTTVTGSYGTAILSRYPLENVRTVFTYSDTDEIGTTEAEIVVDGNRFTIYCVHPDGSDAAMLTFANTLLTRSQNKENVIALGDYNLRSDEEAYQNIATVFHNVPNSAGHIDHIFLSHDLQMINPVYIPAPESATDHPLLYADVTWEK